MRTVGREIDNPEIVACRRCSKTDVMFEEKMTLGGNQDRGEFEYPQYRLHCSFCRENMGWRNSIEAAISAWNRGKKR